MWCTRSPGCPESRRRVVRVCHSVYVLDALAAIARHEKREAAWVRLVEQASDHRRRRPQAIEGPAAPGLQAVRGRVKKAPELVGVLGTRHVRPGRTGPGAKVEAVNRDELNNIRQALQDALNAVPESDSGNAPPRNIHTIWGQITAATDALQARLENLQPIRQPPAFFDPADPRLFGVSAALALVGQTRSPLATIGERPFYGSGVYAIYYTGDFEPYQPISGTEHPIYVGKADPAHPHAKKPRTQGTRLHGRLRDHRKTIEKAGNLEIADFECRYLVVASGWQITAENALIGMFQPIWNKETNILLGFGKHGDSADTRRNSRSPWDTLHPGRGWAGSEDLEDRRTTEEIIAKVKAHFEAHPPIVDASVILRTLLASVEELE